MNVGSGYALAGSQFNAEATIESSNADLDRNKPI